MRHEFPHPLVRQAYEQCGHQCECTHPDCDHDADEYGRCTQILRWGAWEEGEDSPDSWEPRPINRGGPPYISNIRILCTNCSRHAASRPAAAS